MMHGQKNIKLSLKGFLVPRSFNRDASNMFTCTMLFDRTSEVRGTSSLFSVCLKFKHDFSLSLKLKLQSLVLRSWPEILFYPICSAYVSVMTLHISVSPRSCTIKVSDIGCFKYHFRGQWNSSFSVTCYPVFHHFFQLWPICNMRKSSNFCKPFCLSVHPSFCWSSSAEVSFSCHFPLTFGIIYLDKFPNSVYKNLFCFTFPDKKTPGLLWRVKYVIFTTQLI